MNPVKENCLMDGHARTPAVQPPIDRVLDELLLEIFAVASYKSPGHSVDGDTDIVTLITITHTCRRWRNIAIGSSHLWNSINFEYYSPTQVKLCLARSNVAPLQISGSFPTSDSSLCDQFTALFAKRADRIQRIKIQVDAPRHYPMACLRLASAPLLESLTLNAIIMHDLPANFFGGYMPRLKSIDLFGFTPTWSPPPFASLNLTHLSIAGLRRPSLTSLLETLETLPSLVSFDTLHSLPLPPQITTYEGVHLPMLRTLVLDDAVPASLLLLQYISFPESTVLAIYDRSTRSESQDCAPGLVQHFSSRADPIRSLYVKELEYGAKVHASAHHVDDRPLTQWPKFHFSVIYVDLVHITEIDPSVVPTSLMLEFCRRLPFASVTSCCLDGLHDMRPHWLSMLALVPNLEDLSITGVLLGALIDSLRAPGLLKFPCLSILSICALQRQQIDQFVVLLTVLKDRERKGKAVDTVYVDEVVCRRRRPRFLPQLCYDSLRDTKVIGRDSSGGIWFRSSNAAGSMGEEDAAIMGAQRTSPSG